MLVCFLSGRAEVAHGWQSPTKGKIKAREGGRKKEFEKEDKPRESANFEKLPETKYGIMFALSLSLSLPLSLSLSLSFSPFHLFGSLWLKLIGITCPTTAATVSYSPSEETSWVLNQNTLAKYTGILELKKLCDFKRKKCLKPPFISVLIKPMNRNEFFLLSFFFHFFPFLLLLHLQHPFLLLLLNHV